MGVEDLGYATAHGRDKASAAAARTDEPRDAGGRQGAARPPADLPECNPGRVARETGMAARMVFEHRAAVAGVAEDGAAAEEKSLDA